MSLVEPTVLPSSWRLVPIEDVARLVRGITYKKEHARESIFDRAIPLLRATNITGKALTFSSLVFVPASYVSNDQFLRNGDVVIASSSGSKEVVGKAGQFFSVENSFSFGAFCTVLRPESVLEYKYFGYYFQTTDYRKLISDISAGSNINNIKSSGLASHQIAISPRAEQTRIVEKLEELLSDLDAGVAELKAAQKKLGQYRQSLLKAAVEGALTAEWREQNKPEESGVQLLQRILQQRRARWQTKQLAKFAEQGKVPPKDWQAKYPEPVAPDIAKMPELPERWVWASLEQIAADEPYSLAIGPFGSNLKVPDYRDAGVPLVFVRNIRSGRYGGKHAKFVTPEKAAELSAHSIKGGDVLVTKMGEPPGDADVYPADQPMAIITADCIKVRCSEDLMAPHFLATVINSYIGQMQIQPMTQGVAQKKVSLGRFSNLAVPVPTFKEQLEIVELLLSAKEQADHQGDAIEHSLKQSAAQRKNILKAAFSGQLVPQDPSDEPASVLLERIRSERAGRENNGKKTRRKEKVAA